MAVPGILMRAIFIIPAIPQKTAAPSMPAAVFTELIGLYSQQELAYLDHNHVRLEALDHSDNGKRYSCLDSVTGWIMVRRMEHGKG
jgi:hypothetical protein